MLPKTFSLISGFTLVQDYTDALRQDLVDEGVLFHEVEGCYSGMPERSFLIVHPGTMHGFVDSLGKKYNQESVLHSTDLLNEIRFSNGATSLVGVGIAFGEFEDNYTVLNGKKFRLNVGS